MTVRAVVDSGSGGGVVMKGWGNDKSVVVQYIVETPMCSLGMIVVHLQMDGLFMNRLDNL